MSNTPVLHHEARGIHPAAFVSNTPPNVSIVQEHVLWVDTSVGPPYALKEWDAGVGQWLLIGSAGAAAPDACCGTIIPTQPITDTGSNIVNLTSRCGAATRMADYLELYYSRVRSLLITGITAIAGLGLAGIIDVVVTGATGGLDLPWIAIVQPWVIKAAQLIGGWIIQNTVSTNLPGLDSSDNATILEGVYKALPTDGGPITVTDQTIQAWQQFIIGATMPAGTHAQDLLTMLIGAVSLGSWQQLAYFGSYDPKSSCAGWSLLGTAFQGGATLGVTIEQSFQGGATLGIAVNNSFRGGAVLP